MGLSRKQENLPRPAGPEILEEELALPDSELQSEYVAPQTDLEKMLATVWRQILGFERIGIDDNFFRLGGDSLLAMQVISRVCVMFRMELPPKCLFEAPTINKLALYMIAHEARPGLVEKTARILMHIDGMTEEAVSQELSAKNKVGIKGS
jgi:acyl carrier protein